MVEHPGLFLGQNHHSPRAVGKPLEHVSSLLYRAVRQGRFIPTQLFRI
ncbi:hypothetical protein B005_2578 [Nocardiopsis alba ATCC BAA-2165]|uniref:Uncharacterized protein n=1 Tax=Nocardiopsis alba (strain ATCC BAA-2165 / BE74) TaxID=1205910 RepID=J7LBC7_NOCAA|nr:hypothetical protein B005_2578 [Nocardiopsis alba ATCC BAA-2165]